MTGASNWSCTEIKALLLCCSGSCFEGLLLCLYLRLWSALRAYGLFMNAMRDDQPSARIGYWSRILQLVGNNSWEVARCVWLKTNVVWRYLGMVVDVVDLYSWRWKILRTGNDLSMRGTALQVAPCVLTQPVRMSALLMSTSLHSVCIPHVIRPRPISVIWIEVCVPIHLTPQISRGWLRR